jgi:hypothetical protein
MAGEQPEGLSKSSAKLHSGAQSAVRTLSKAGLRLKRALWVWPIVIALLLGTVGWFLRGAIEYQLQSGLASELQTILQADVTALKLWISSQISVAVSAANDAHVMTLSQQLLNQAARPETTQLELLQAPQLKDLRDELTPLTEAHDYIGFVLVDPTLRTIASDRNELISAPLPGPDRPAVTERVFQGEGAVSAPRKSTVLLPTSGGEMKVGVPTMFVWAPLRGPGGKVIAALGLRIRPELEFSSILQVGRAGKSGETYAFNRDGLLLSQSRFDDDLRQIGLLTEDENSVLNLQLRDPEANLSAGQRPAKRRADQPLTRLVTQALTEQPGVDVMPHRDYRGTLAVGAWDWIPVADFGIVIQQDAREAFAVMDTLRVVFWSMFAALGVCACVIFVAMILLARKNREARKAALEVKRLGQFALEKKLGEGGMGVVYLAHHAMLLRPTAVKFLEVDKTNEQTVARFEREVRLTSRLAHPNTIAIYDYGRTDEGIFYYAMEYLDGVNLEDLIRRYGPQPEERVIHLLRQACGSLAEAHSIGLIHRDIKPANLVLTQRGGIPDFVKLLDFGLVKAVDSQKQSRLTTAGAMAGTPLYLSPEAIQSPDSVDARSDLYALGAAGYFLLTGSPVFDGQSIVEIVQKHVHAAPQPPSQRLGKPVSPELEKLLLQCLAKSPGDRPQTADVLADLLDQCPASALWTKARARQWWAIYRPTAVAATSGEDTSQPHIGATLLTN